jgi:hypothetical protein
LLLSEPLHIGAHRRIARRHGLQSLCVVMPKGSPAMFEVPL